MEAFMNSLYAFVSKIQPITYLLVAMALIVCGIMFIIPSQKAKDFAKGALPWIIVGCGLVIGAMTIAQEVSATWVF